MHVVLDHPGLATMLIMLAGLKGTAGRCSTLGDLLSSDPTDSRVTPRVLLCCINYRENKKRGCHLGRPVPRRAPRNTTLAW